MKAIKLTILLLLVFSTNSFAQQSFVVEVVNPTNKSRSASPVSININKYKNIKSALVKCNGKEIPCQLDDINMDDTYDELCFLTDINGMEHKKFTVTLYNNGEPKAYNPGVYVEMMLENKRIKESNKQDLYISNLTVEKGTNAYWMLHHHGVAFESNLVAYRLYFDHRQTVDIYGKNHKGLELKQTQFYPSKQQKEAGFGDDVLWVGNTLGVGALRGWYNNEPQMLNDVQHRTQRIISSGPIRTIVEVIDKNWKVNPQQPPIDMYQYYTLYADHRDCAVDITFSKSVGDYSFATGLINVKNSTEFSDSKGLRGCWGTDWPVSEKDSLGHKRETVGLGINIPQQYLKKELPANNDNYVDIVTSKTNKIHYNITFCSKNEDFGFNNEKEWNEYLKEWKYELCNPLTIHIIK